MEERGFVRLGDRKIAEAFTSVSPQERLLLWKAFKQGRTYSFDFSMLNSKLIHKLRRLGLRQLERRPVTPGEELLNKIKQFNLEIGRAHV